MTSLVKFPTYDRLSILPPLSEINNSKISQTISSIRMSNPKKAYEIFETIYAFCIHHYVLEKGNYPCKPPYGILQCTGGKGLVINIGRDFPVNLLMIIHRYLNEQVIVK